MKNFIEKGSIKATIPFKEQVEFIGVVADILRVLMTLANYI